MYREGYIDALHLEEVLILTRRLRSRQPQWPLRRCATIATQHLICPCVRGDVLPGRGSMGEIMFAEIDEVVRRLETAEANPEGSGTAAKPAWAGDAVDAASDQSFPASDPPGWIGGDPN